MWKMFESIQAERTRSSCLHVSTWLRTKERRKDTLAMIHQQYCNLKQQRDSYSEGKDALL